MSTPSALDGVAIESNDRLNPDEVYMVSGDCIAAVRNGVVVKLEGVEKKRVQRWLLRKGGGR